MKYYFIGYMSTSILHNNFISTYIWCQENSHSYFCWRPFTGQLWCTSDTHFFCGTSWPNAAEKFRAGDMKFLCSPKATFVYRQSAGFSQVLRCLVSKGAWFVTSYQLPLPGSLIKKVVPGRKSIWWRAQHTPFPYVRNRWMHRIDIWCFIRDP